MLKAYIQEAIARLELESKTQKDEHRQDLIELSNHIDEMRERDEKKDAEIEQLRLTLYDLEGQSTYLIIN